MSKTDHDNLLLELIPDCQLKIMQLHDESNSVLPTYKFRKPPTVQDLQHLVGLLSIWQENQTLIVPGKPTDL
jgi:hypothetical protein